MNPTNFSFSSNDGLVLLGRAWITQNEYPKGIVALIHSLGEHSGRYDHIGKKFTENGYHLVGFDLRGHGLSKGHRGHSPGLTHLMDDFQRFLGEVNRIFGNKPPIFLYGQGWGGNLVLNFGLTTNYAFKGAIVTSPALQLSKPCHIERTVINWIAKILPRWPLKIHRDPDAISRDPAIVKAFRDDVFTHNTVSARLYLDMVESGTLAINNADQWKPPLLLMHGTVDQIALKGASETFAQRAGDNTCLVLWEGCYHELHNDFGSEMVIGKMISWLDQVPERD